MVVVENGYAVMDMDMDMGYGYGYEFDKIGEVDCCSAVLLYALAASHAGRYTSKIPHSPTLRPPPSRSILYKLRSLENITHFVLSCSGQKRGDPLSLVFIRAWLGVVTYVPMEFEGGFVLHVSTTRALYT